VVKLKPSHFLFWQSVSFPTAYVSANVFLNTNKYVGQLSYVLGTGSNINSDESVVIALIVFLTLFLFPNLYVFASLRSLKDDLINKKVQPDASITPHNDGIGVSGKEYKITQKLHGTPLDFIIISLFPLMLNYSAIVPVLAFLAVIILIGLSYPDTSFITMNPYLRLKYDIYMLENDDKTLYIVVEKEKGFERPGFSNYVIDWLYGHAVLIGFRKEE
jgi:hypothetical protein